MSDLNNKDLQAGNIPVDPDVLLPFFREAYGPNYTGDDQTLAYFNRVNTIVGLKDELGGLAAAAMIEGVSGDRIISIATSPEVSRFGNRGLLMLKLLEACRDEDRAQWISIGNQYETMLSIAKKAGMARVTGIDAIEGILKQADLSDHYELSNDSEGLPLITTRDGHNKGNLQQVWAWGLSEQ